MRRVLQWACWISTVLLLVLSATVTQARRGNNLTDPILVVTGDAPDRMSTYYLMWPDTQARYALPLADEYSVFDRRVGQWLYFYERTATGMFLLYRVRLNGLGRQDILLVDYPQNPVWSGDWIYYRYLRSDGWGYDLWRVRNDGKQAHNLTMGQGVNLSPSLIMPRGGWVYFKATVSPNGSMVAITGIYRVRVDGTDFQYLSSQLPSVYGLLLVDPNGEWMIVSWQNGLYRVATDGSHYTSLPAPDLAVGQRYEQATLLNRTLVVSGGSYPYLLQLDTQQVIWDSGQTPNYGGLWTVSPSGEWVYMRLFDLGVTAIRTDGTASTALPAMQNLSGIVGWTSDGSWLIFQVSDGDWQEIRRISADHQKVETLYRYIPRYSPPLLSLDGRWVYFQTDADLLGISEIFRIRPNGSQLENLSSGLPFAWMAYQTDVELPPSDFRPAWLALAVGGFILTGFIMKGRRRKIT